jgi:hypothetical protein
MKVKIQVVTITDDGQETIKDIACVERHDLTPETFGLSLAEVKAVLQVLQEVVVEWQLHTYLQQQRTCPHCGHARRSKGVHHTVFRTVFGTVPVESPRVYHCGCQAHATTSFSPLATLLPERTTPDLLYLETKWAAFMSYGLTVKLLQDVLPLDEPLEAVTIRNHVLKLAQRLRENCGLISTRKPRSICCTHPCTTVCRWGQDLFPMPTSMGSLITPWRDFFSAGTRVNKMGSQEHYRTCSGRCSWDPRQQSAALRQHRAQCVLINTLMREYYLSKTSREYCLSSYMLLFSRLYSSYSQRSGGKHGRLSEMHTSARGQGREG